MKKDNRGGAREGAGRPKRAVEFSEDFKSNLWKALRKKAKDTGKDIYEVIADFAYDKKVRDRVRLGVFELIAQTMVIQESINESHNYQYGPGIYLPKTQEKPKEIEEKEEEFRSKMIH